MIRLQRRTIVHVDVGWDTRGGWQTGAKRTAARPPLPAKAWGTDRLSLGGPYGQSATALQPARGDLMGGGNVSLVLARWAHLPDPAFRCLVMMANVVHDDDQNPTWWGGREALAVALGRKVPPDAGHKRDCKCIDCLARRAAFQAVKHAVAQLVTASAVSLVKSPRTGRRAEYRLNLGYAPPTPEVEAASTPQGQVPPTPQGQGGPTPKEQTGGVTEEDQRGPTSPEATTSPGSVDDPRAPDQSPQPKLCPHGKPDVWHGINHGCRECRHAGQ